MRGCSQTERRKPNMMWWNAALFCTNVWRWTKGGQKATLSENILRILSLSRHKYVVTFQRALRAFNDGRAQCWKIFRNRLDGGVERPHFPSERELCTRSSTKSQIQHLFPRTSKEPSALRERLARCLRSRHTQQCLVPNCTARSRWRGIEARAL